MAEEDGVADDAAVAAAALGNQAALDGDAAAAAIPVWEKGNAFQRALWSSNRCAADAADGVPNPTFTDKSWLGFLDMNSRD